MWHYLTAHFQMRSVCVCLYVSVYTRTTTLVKKKKSTAALVNSGLWTFSGRRFIGDLRNLLAWSRLRRPSAKDRRESNRGMCLSLR